MSNISNKKKQKKKKQRFPYRFPSNGHVKVLSQRQKAEPDSESAEGRKMAQP